MIEFPFASPANIICRLGISAALFLMHNLESDLSRKLFTSRLFKYEEMESLLQKIKNVQAADFINITEKELYLMYMAVFINAKMFGDSETFYKWFFHFDNGEIDNVQDFKLHVINVSKELCGLIEENYVPQLPLLSGIKKNTENVFGVL